MKAVDAVDRKDVIELFDHLDVLDHGHHEEPVVLLLHPFELVDVDPIVSRPPLCVIGPRALGMEPSHRDKFLAVSLASQIGNLHAMSAGVQQRDDPL